MGLVDKNADSDDTMLLITEKIFDEMKTQHQNGHLILVGDGKTYAHLRKTMPLWLGVRKATHIPRGLFSLQDSHQSTKTWIPRYTPCSVWKLCLKSPRGLSCTHTWHMLKNYQEVLMKVYHSCGLKELAKSSEF